MTFLLDSRAGSYKLANIEPVRSLLPLCPGCRGTGQHPEATPRHPAPCRGTGRQLSLITTSSGRGGPDVLICGNGPKGSVLVAVEVKEIRELFQAADSGRLQAYNEGQLQAMLTDYQQNWLVWYGAVRYADDGYLEEPRGRYENGSTRWTRMTRSGDVDGKPRKSAELDGLLVAVAAMGVLTCGMRSEKEVARWLGALYAWWSKPWNEHQFTRTFHKAPSLPHKIEGYTSEQIERAGRVFDRYPGLGMERSLAAAKVFGNVQEMANAGEKEWQMVPGVGKVIAGAVVKAFRA